MRRGLSAGRGQAQDLRAAARPPLRPAAFFCAVVPPCFELPPEPDFLPPRADAPGELAIFAARSLDMPLSLRASYCFSFLTFAFLVGMAVDYPAARGKTRYGSVWTTTSANPGCARRIRSSTSLASA